LGVFGIVSDGVEQKLGVDLDDGEKVVQLVRDEARDLVRLLESV
jgi:hypothetical protein